MPAWDVDPWAEQEALELERLDVDIEMAELTAYGNALARAEKAGRCTHGSAQGYQPAGKGNRSKDAEGLRPGQVRCVTCKRVFGSDDEWLAAIDAAVTGDE